MSSSKSFRDITVYANNQAAFVASRDLLGRESRIHIRHNNERYMLRLTRAGKLILTK